MSTNQSNNLRPCPFCGSKALTNIFLDYEDIENPPTEVTCENERCIYGWWLSPKDWNTRPIEDKLQSRIAELEAYIDQLIEVGNGMKSFLTPYVDGFRDSYPATSAWESLVKDWKEREE
jgi:hypothetical protein